MNAIGKNRHPYTWQAGGRRRRDRRQDRRDDRQDRRDDRQDRREDRRDRRRH